MRRRLGQAGRRSFREKFCWRLIAKSYEEILRGARTGPDAHGWELDLIEREFKGRLPAVCAELHKLRAELVTARSELEDTRAELVTARSELEDTRAELVRARSETEGIRAELVGARSGLAGTTAELVGARSETEGIRAELAGARSELEDTRAELHRSRGKLLTADHFVNRISTSFSPIGGLQNGYWLRTTRTRRGRWGVAIGLAVAHPRTFLLLLARRVRNYLMALN